MSKQREVVISGVAGAFPGCDSIKILEEKIFTDENLIINDKSWLVDNHDIPPFVGRLMEPYRFDQLFFGIHRKLCLVMDAHARHSTEKTYEALCDAGINPSGEYGGNVAVLISSMTCETEYGSVMVSKNSGHAMLGHSRSMQANRISYFFNFKGPSLCVDCSWVGAVQALKVASDLVSKGFVKMAIVGATNMLVYPELSIHYESLKKLNPEGKTKSFDADALGYNRSEGLVLFVLQRAEDAMRSYASLVKVDCCTEMSHPTVFPEIVGYKNFISDFYSDVPIKNSEIAYIEGDGSASLTVDAMELNAISDVLCPGREKPLLVGSCKSKLGHTESCAAFSGVVNALISFKTGYIPPVYHFKSPNPLVPALFDGRMKVVSEKTPLEGDYIGVTVIGLASIYGHVLLKKNPKSQPALKEHYTPPDGIPRIFLLSGRDEKKMKAILQNIETEPVDENYYALNHKLFKTSIPKHLFRGYSVVGEKGSISKVTPFPGGTPPPIWFIFSGMGSQWNEMGVGLMKFPVIRRSIEKCHNILMKKGIDLINIITSDDPSIFDNILHAFVGIAAIQIGLVDFLEELGIVPEGMVGHSVGELGCSYADKCLTAEQVILAAYARGKASNDAQLIRGMMAAVGKSYAQIKDELPPEIEVACHNSSVSCTLSGPAEIMEKYVQDLKNRGIFARLVNVANIAYHSKNIAPAAPYLLKSLKEIIPEPKLRSSKWISSSCPESNWDTELAKYCSAEYHTNNLLSYVLFEEATAHVPKGAICIEIAPHGLLQAIVKKSLSTCSHIALTNRAKDGSFFLIEALGNMFTSGVQFDLSKIYPKVEFPVPRETEFLNIITWDHSDLWVPLALQYDVVNRESCACWKEIELKSNEITKTFISNHCIRGKFYYPKSNLISLMMDYLKDNNEKSSTKFKSYDFTNIQFHDDILFNDEENTILHILFQSSGNFEIMDKNETKLAISGQLAHSIKGLPVPFLDSDFVEKQETKIYVSDSHIYDYFEINDCVFGGEFRNIESMTIFEKGFAGKIKWRNNPELYIEGIFKLLAFYSSINKDILMDIDKILQLLVDPTEFPECDEEIVDIYYDENPGLLVAKGIRLLTYSARPLTQKMTDTLDLRQRVFIPYLSVKKEVDFVDLCFQLFKENSYSKELHFQYILEENSKSCRDIARLFDDKDRLSSHKIHLRPRNAVSDMSREKIADDCYLLIGELDYQDNLEKLIKYETPFYFVHSGNQSTLAKEFSKSITPILEKVIDGVNVVLYKQKKYNFENYSFVEIPTDVKRYAATGISGSGPQDVTYLVVKYELLVDTVDFLESFHDLFNVNQRFIFIDGSSPKFNINTDFYKEQIAKGLKINIAFKGMWGSIRENIIEESNKVRENLGRELALNYVSCKTVDVKVIGLNLQSLIYPKKYTKLSVVEYSGFIGEEPVFGLGRITDDNMLEVDPHYCWKKPENWSFEEAATVPLYYAVAYDIIFLRNSRTNRPWRSVLVHAGHTGFSQAVIAVVLSLNKEVYTTCYSERQKRFISTMFPQIKESNIYQVQDDMNSFHDGILSESAYDGPQMVIDALEESTLRHSTFKCTGDLGCYYLLTNDDLDVGFAYGMSTFRREVAAYGYNPSLIFARKDEHKLELKKLLSAGIKSKVVKPLERYTLTETLTYSQAAETIVSISNEEFPKKSVMPLKKRQAVPDPSKEVMNKKNYMIVGAYNNLWFDLLKWLVSKGADSVHIILNQEEVPMYLKKRFSNFIAKHKYIRVLFSGTENLTSVQTCSQFIKAFQNGSTLDSVFYLKPGFEKQMTNIDYALRLNSKSSNLVAIGLQICRIIERRRSDGFRGVSFILLKSNLRNCMVLNAINSWFHKCDENEDVILVDKTKPKDICRMSNLSDILPSNGYELIDLQKNISVEPCFIEVNTLCGPKKFSRDLNPVFLFPGMKVALLEKFISHLMYPTFVAQYPAFIKSLNEIAVPFAEIMTRDFDYDMFTIIAEGWSGPLALTISKILEEKGKVNEIILLDGAPECVKNWIFQQDSIISKCIPTIKEGIEVSINDLRSWIQKLSKIVIKVNGGNYTLCEIEKGFETIINRLDVVQNYSCKNEELESTVHLFTPNSENDIDDLKEMCKNSFHLHSITSTGAFLENATLLEQVNNLPLVEYKMRAAKQQVKTIATLHLAHVNATAYNRKEFD